MADERHHRPNSDALRSRARWAQILLVVVAVADVFAVVSDIAEYRLLGTDFSVAEGEASDDRQGVIGIVQFSLLVTAAVVFIRWFKRAYDNVEATGRGARFGTGWAIGGWFVPILNLWRPKQIANDLWRADNVDASERVSPLVTLWWAAFLVSNWVSQIAARLSFGADTVDELRRSSTAYAIADAVDIAAAVLAIWVVRTITARQVANAPAGQEPDY